MMGRVKEWSNMLEGFFQEVFFEARWMFLPEEVLPVPGMRDGFYDDSEEMGRDVPQRWLREEDWDKKEEKQKRDEILFEDWLRLSSAAEKNFDDRRNFTLESFAAEGFNANESRWAYKIADSDAGRYAFEAFEKMLGGEMVYTDVWEEAPRERMTYDAVSEKYGLEFSEEPILRRWEYWDYISEREGISLKRERVEKILSGAEKEGHGQSHEIKIEMVREDGARDEIDMDETLDRLTERLCNLMAKGADGFYL